MSHHKSHRGLIGGILGVGVVLCLTYWIGGLLGLRGMRRFLCLPPVLMLLMLLLSYL